MPPFPELKDITPPTAPPLSSPVEVQMIVTVAFFALVGLGLALGLVFWIRASLRRRRLPPLPVTAATEARRALENLRSRAGTLSAAEFGQHASDILRRYLQREHGLLALYRTTEELFGRSTRPGAPPPLPQVRPFEPVLQAADALKFAGPTPTAADFSSLVDQAMAAIHYAEEKITLPVTAAPAPQAPPAPAPANAEPSPSTPSASEPPRISPPPLPSPPAADPLPPGPPPPPANAARGADVFTLGSASGAHVIP